MTQQECANKIKELFQITGPFISELVNEAVKSANQNMTSESATENLSINKRALVNLCSAVEMIDNLLDNCYAIIERKDKDAALTYSYFIKEARRINKEALDKQEEK